MIRFHGGNVAAIKDSITFEDFAVTDKSHHLPISDLLNNELVVRGYSSIEHLRRLSIFDAAQIPWMNGMDWQTINQAVGRKPFPDVS